MKEVTWLSYVKVQMGTGQQLWDGCRHPHPNWNRSFFSQFYVITKLWKCSVPKQGQNGRINIICRPSGRYMTAATALMDFPFSRQQHTNSNTKDSINYCPDILQLFNWYLNIHVLMSMLLSMVCLCCLLEIKDSWFLIPFILPPVFVQAAELRSW